MITFALFALLAVTAVGFLALARAVKYAPAGYEDVGGFHHCPARRAEARATQARWGAEHAA